MKHIHICCEYAEMVLVSGGWETSDYGLVHVILLSGFDEKQGQPTTKWRIHFWHTKLSLNTASMFQSSNPDFHSPRSLRPPDAAQCFAAFDKRIE